MGSQRYVIRGVQLYYFFECQQCPHVVFNSDSFLISALHKRLLIMFFFLNHLYYWSP
jgi:hypothetical protein